MVHQGDIKIWKLKNQRLRFIAPLETDVEVLSSEDVNIAVETNTDPEVVRLKRLHDAKVAKEKERKQKREEKPAPLSNEVENQSDSGTIQDEGVVSKKLDNIFRKIPEKDYYDIKSRSVHNADPKTLVLGKYRPTVIGGVEDWSVPGPDSYVAIARTENATYFDLGTEWDSIVSKYDMSPDDMFYAFKIPVLDDAVSSGKQIKFTHDPRTQGGFLEQEWEYLQSAHGFKRLKKVDGIWYAK